MDFLAWGAFLIRVRYSKGRSEALGGSLVPVAGLAT
jgi:hypothetical protein